MQLPYITQTSKVFEAKSHEYLSSITRKGKTFINFNCMKHVNVVKQLLVQLIWLWQVKDCSPYVQSKFNAKNSELSALSFISRARFICFHNSENLDVILN